MTKFAKSVHKLLKNSNLLNETIKSFPSFYFLNEGKTVSGVTSSTILLAWVKKDVGGNMESTNIIIGTYDRWPRNDEEIETSRDMEMKRAAATWV